MDPVVFTWYFSIVVFFSKIRRHVVKCIHSVKTSFYAPGDAACNVCYRILNELECVLLWRDCLSHPVSHLGLRHCDVIA